MLNTEHKIAQSPLSGTHFTGHLRIIAETPCTFRIFSPFASNGSGSGTGKIILQRADAFGLITFYCVIYTRARARAVSTSRRVFSDLRPAISRAAGSLNPAQSDSDALPAPPYEKTFLVGRPLSTPTA